MCSGTLRQQVSYTTHCSLLAIEILLSSCKECIGAPSLCKYYSYLSVSQMGLEIGRQVGVD